MLPVVWEGAVEMPISSSVAELDAEGGLYAGVEGGKASNKLMLLVLL